MFGDDRNRNKLEFHDESFFSKPTTSLMAGLPLNSSVHREAILKYSLTSSSLNPSLGVLESNISM
ncbi:hypothetical protein OIU76_006988 [Salix suchowensis]|nr:hypothetical protein OIU76_006988 [Salix suchowensis]